MTAAEEKLARETEVLRGMGNSTMEHSTTLNNAAMESGKTMIRKLDKIAAEESSTLNRIHSELKEAYISNTGKAA